MPSSFHRTLNLRSVLKYAWWRAARQRRPVTLSLKHGGRFQLRPSRLGGQGNNDYGVAYEVFVDRFYDDVPLDPASVLRVVDLGGNVGLSCIFWLTKYPYCWVDVFEPHPGHVAQMKLNLDLNGWRDRVTIYEAAAGTSPGTLHLSDRGSGSSVMFSWQDDPGIEVPVVDVFEAIGSQPIDILKIDIEGGEYSLLADPRFAQLDVRYLVLEWHKLRIKPDARAWSLDQLAAHGFEVRELFTESDYGM